MTAFGVQSTGWSIFGKKIYIGSDDFVTSLFVEKEYIEVRKNKMSDCLK